MRGQFALVIKNDDKNLNNIGKVVDCSGVFGFDTSDGDLTLENTIVGGGYHVDLYSRTYELKFCPFCGSKSERNAIS